MNDKIETLENAIRHINTAIDVDPWAKEAAVEAMRYMIASLVSQPQRMRGRWIEDGHHIRCNKCRAYMCKTDGEGDAIPRSYCPNCGAQMEVENEIN